MGGFTLLESVIRFGPNLLTSSLCFGTVLELAMEVELPILSVVELPSLLHAVAADTLLAAAQSLSLVFSLSKSSLFVPT